MIEENDGVCSHWKIPDVCQVVWIVDGWERDDTEAIGEPVKICDECRRILCTCERCSASDWRDDITATVCRRDPPPPGVAEILCPMWCRDGWQQARPWTMAEVREWLGLEVSDTRPTEWTAPCPKFGSGESVDQRRGEPCPHCGDPRGHWPEEADQ